MITRTSSSSMSVKPREPRLALPVFVASSVNCLSLRATVQITHTRNLVVLLIRHRQDPGVGLAGHRIDGYPPHVALLHELFERCRVAAIVAIVVVHRLPHHAQVVFERGFARTLQPGG